MDDKRRDAIVQAYNEESDKFQAMLSMFYDLTVEFTADELADFNAVMNQFYERQSRLARQGIDSEIQRAQAKTTAQKVEFMARMLAQVEQNTEELRQMTRKLQSLLRRYQSRIS